MECISWCVLCMRHQRRVWVFGGKRWWPYVRGDQKSTGSKHYSGFDVVEHFFNRPCFPISVVFLLLICPICWLVLVEEEDVASYICSGVVSVDDMNCYCVFMINKDLVMIRVSSFRSWFNFFNSSGVVLQGALSGVHLEQDGVGVCSEWLFR